MRALRNGLVLSGAITLAACGGDTGAQSVGSVAPPVATPTPTHSFVNPTEPKSYEGIGGAQHYEYYVRPDEYVPAQGGNAAQPVRQRAQLYAGDANTARDSGITVTYNPRDAIFELTINRSKAIVNVANFRFQDPVHRTDWGGAAQPQPGTPQMPAGKNILYLQAGGSAGQLQNPRQTGATQSDLEVGQKGFSSERMTFFYQKPGTTTKYVTYAGFLHNTYSVVEAQDPGSDVTYIRHNYAFDRAAFAFGERTGNSAVPKTGTGTFTGDMIATMVYNPMLDTDLKYPTFFQWIDGSQTTTIDFAGLTVKSSFSGTVHAPAIDAFTSGLYMLPAGTMFSATASGTIDLVNKGGFTGSFTCASFAGACVAGQPNPLGALNIAGSSLDGAFFGPNGEEIGGGFRIVGGTPDERIDILGAYTGKK